MQITIVHLCISDNQNLKLKIKPIYNSTENMKYLGINLTKDVQGLYN